MFTGKNLKPLMLAGHKHHVLYEDDAVIPGFYNWPKVWWTPNNFILWDDVITHDKIIQGNYNVIVGVLSRPECLSFMSDSVQKSRQGFGHTYAKAEHPSLKKENLEGWSDTAKDLKNSLGIKMVAGVDYAIQMWHEIDTFTPAMLRKNLEPFDFIFVAEPTQGIALYELMNRKKDIYFMPHPTNTYAIKDMLKGHRTKSPTVRCLVHRYDLEWVMPTIATLRVPKVLASHDGKRTNVIFTCLEGHDQFLIQLKSNGLQVEAGKKHTEWLKVLADTKVLVDSYHGIKTYGRTPTECACARTPCIGSDATFLQGKLWPELTVKAYDVKKQSDLLERLLKYPKFYQDCVDFAYREVEKVNYDNCLKYFLTMVNEKAELTKDYWNPEIKCSLQFKGGLNG